MITIDDMDSELEPYGAKHMNPKKNTNKQKNADRSARELKSKLRCACPFLFGRRPDTAKAWSIDGPSFRETAVTHSAAAKCAARAVVFENVGANLL